MGVIYAHADLHGGMDQYCTKWLCYNPAKALSTAGIDTRLMSVAEFVESRPLDEIIVVERLLWNGCSGSCYEAMPDGPTKSIIREFADLRVLDTIEYVQSRGCKVMAVFDDHYESYPDRPEFRNTRNLWLAGSVNGKSIGFEPLEDFRRGLGLVDAVMTPSRFLCEHYGKYARKMYHVRNRPLLSEWRIANNGPASDGRLVVGWSGTAQHFDTWQGNDALLDGLASLRDRIVVRGVIPGDVARLIAGSGVDVESMPPVSPSEFQQVVASYDIGICPLHGDYDQGRSWIKWLECALVGRPVVASPLAGAYSDCRGGYMVKDESARSWATAISWLFNEDMRQVKAGEGLSWAYGQGWDENIQSLIDIFVEVLHA